MAENGIRNAAFCESAALRVSVLNFLYRNQKLCTILRRVLLSREKGAQESPRLRSNKSPSEAFKRQSGLRKQMEGLCPDKLRRLS